VQFLVKVCAVIELAAIFAIEKSNKNLFENKLADRILFLCVDLKNKVKNREFIIRYPKFIFYIKF
jgi:tRNA1(Val) A37 N6-methylase TrmN6